MARELASHLRLKLLKSQRAPDDIERGEGTGFSSEIETVDEQSVFLCHHPVARELASHLRLKRLSARLQDDR